MLFVTTLIIGLYVGTPIAVEVYQIGISSEVSQLFALMPFVYFYALLPLCLISALAFKFIRRTSSKVICGAYLLLCSLAVPGVFTALACQSTMVSALNKSCQGKPKAASTLCYQIT